ncbi:hypothetical protein [Ktedonobacter sp. SOSP1-85]|uniref:hypothetical protein n=1 Tax=Ktedonobacter sp. SOSP1-85 TaxID=2778367 RepID=UPI0019169EA1|nr:hypothetical protein [Ktedonobacter sp. SOSP1-85]
MPSRELSLLLLLGWMILLSASGAAILQSLRQRQWGWLFAMIGSFLIWVLIGHLTSGTYTPDQTTSLAFTLVLHTVMFFAGPLLFALFADPRAKSRREEVSLHVSNTVQRQRDWEKSS